jgi:hypothetical protein
MSVSSCFPTVLSADTSAVNAEDVNLNQVITDILATGSISRSNQSYLLKLTRSNQSLSAPDVVLINRVFQRLQIGLLRVVND